MRKGFIFNNRLCVSCKACSAACMVENGWVFAARRIFTHNPDAFSEGQVVNVSMACNHCKEPVCLTGCPASAYDIDPETGAVILVPERCIGCRYCTWNCPYDAPRYNSVSGIIEKCHFCNHLILSGATPACSSACPTGALGFGDIPDNIDFTGNEIIHQYQMVQILLMRALSLFHFSPFYLFHLLFQVFLYTTVRGMRYRLYSSCLQGSLRYFTLVHG